MERGTDCDKRDFISGYDEGYELEGNRTLKKW